MLQKHSGARAAKKKVDDEPLVTDFGNRAVCKQNYSKMLALPKAALTNCGKDIVKMNVQLVQAGTQKFLKLTPVEEAE